MNRLTGLLNTSVGQKLTLAASGVALIGFLVAHLIGNLTIFQGRETMNAYADWLQGHPLLWAARAGLLGIFLLHTVLAIRLAWDNHQSRPVAYTTRTYQDAAVLSRYIVLTGLLVLAFLVYHILHFTVGVVQPEHATLLDAAGRHDVYGMVVQGFRVPAVAISYVVAMAILALHLLHGLSSLLQTFGLNHASYFPAMRIGATVTVLAIALANASIPVSAVMGWIEP